MKNVKALYTPNEDEEEQHSVYACAKCNFVSASCINTKVDGKITIKESNGLQLTLSCDQSLVESIYNTKLAKFSVTNYANLFSNKYKIITKDFVVINITKL